MKKEELESYPVIFSSSAKIRKVVRYNMGFSRWLSGKEFTCNAGDTGLIPRSGRSSEEGMATHFNILSWKIPWTKETGVESQRARHNLVTKKQQVIVDGLR